METTNKGTSITIIMKHKTVNPVYVIQSSVEFHLGGCFIVTNIALETSSIPEAALNAVGNNFD